MGDVQMSMTDRTSHRILLSLALSAILTGLAAADDKTDEKKKPLDRYMAVTGGTVHTVTGPTISGATVLAKNGRITAIGHDVVIPPEAEVVDATGFHVYPGLVAVSSSGLVGSEPPDDSTNVLAGAAVMASSSASLSSDTIRCEWSLKSGFLTRVFMLRRIFTSPSPGTRVPLISNSSPFGSALRLSPR